MVPCLCQGQARKWHFPAPSFSKSPTRSETRMSKCLSICTPSWCVNCHFCVAFPAGCSLYKGKAPAITHPPGLPSRSPGFSSSRLQVWWVLQTHGIQSLCFLKPNIMRVSLPCVSSLAHGPVSLPFSHTQFLPSCVQHLSTFLTFLHFQIQLLLYIWQWVFFCQSLDHSPVYCDWIWMISSCKCGTWWAQSRPSLPSSQAPGTFFSNIYSDENLNRTKIWIKGNNLIKYNYKNFWLKSYSMVKDWMLSHRLGET